MRRTSAPFRAAPMPQMQAPPGPLLGHAWSGVPLRWVAPHFGMGPMLPAAIPPPMRAQALHIPLGGEDIIEESEASPAPVEAMTRDEDDALLAELAKKVKTLDPRHSRVIDPADCDPMYDKHVIRTEPNIIIVPNFLDDAEIQHLFQIASCRWAPTMVMTAGAKGQISNLKQKSSSLRTSYGALVDYAMTPMVAEIERRLCKLAGMDVNHLERMVMVKYKPGQQYKVHHDGTWRPLTVFIYLNDLPDGDEGETFFPNLDIKIRPRKGCAIMWPNTLGDGAVGQPSSEDVRVMHAGLPPLTSEKYGVNCFFNAAPKRIEANSDQEFLGQGPPTGIVSKPSFQQMPDVTLPNPAAICRPPPQSSPFPNLAVRSSSNRSRGVPAIPPVPGHGIYRSPSPNFSVRCGAPAVDMRNVCYQVMA